MRSFECVANQHSMYDDGPMSLGLREYRRKRQRQRLWTLIRWLLASTAVLAAGAYAYQTGSRLAARNLASLEEQLAQATSKAAVLDAQLQAQREQAKASIDAWRERYERDVPTGELKGLLELVRRKIDTGLTPDRLRFILEHMENKQDCDPDLQRRRLLVETPLSRGSRQPAAFASDSVSISLAGTPARDDSGNPEAWFDPSQPVTVRLTTRDGEASEATGPLPLQAALVAGDRVYHFSIGASIRGFAEVSMQRCRFP